MGCGQSKHQAEVGVVAPPPMGTTSTDEPMTNAEIQSRIDSIEKTESIVLGGMKLRYAYLSQRGYYPDGELLTSPPPLYWSHPCHPLCSSHRIGCHPAFHSCPRQGLFVGVFFGFEQPRSCCRCCCHWKESSIRQCHTHAHAYIHTDRQSPTAVSFVSSRTHCDGSMTLLTFVAHRLRTFMVCFNTTPNNHHEHTCAHTHTQTRTRPTRMHTPSRRTLVNKSRMH